MSDISNLLNNITRQDAERAVANAMKEVMTYFTASEDWTLFAREWLDGERNDDKATARAHSAAHAIISEQMTLVYIDWMNRRIPENDRSSCEKVSQEYALARAAADVAYAAHRIIKGECVEAILETEKILNLVADGMKIPPRES